MRGVNYISEWVVVSLLIGFVCLFDFFLQSVNMFELVLRKKLFMVNNILGFGDYENVCLY